MSDDAMIYSRAVRQIVAGNGPVFNAGERAESSTSVLWLWLLALAHWTTGIEVEQLAVFGGLLLTAAAFVVALDGTRRLHQSLEARQLLIPAGVLLLLAIPPVWDFSTTGLESGLQLFWLAVCWWLLVGSRSATRLRHLFFFSAVVGLGPLIRPELSLVTAVFLVAALVNSKPPRRVVLGALCLAGVLPVAYEIFRAGYYGLLVPLPALAKEASRTSWSRGGAYVWDFVQPYWLADVFGLAYPLDAHFELVDRGAPGHEKILPHVWLLADYADPAEVPPQGVGPEGTTPASVAAARHALTCGELRELQMSVREPMSLRRFQQNLTGALRRTLLRIPTDPFVAEERFCRARPAS